MRSLGKSAKPERSHQLATNQKSKKGAFARGALREFVANRAPNLREIAGISFRTFEEGCAKLPQICRELEINFGQLYANTPFPMHPSPNFLNQRFPMDNVFAGPEKLGLAPKVQQNLWGSAEPFFNKLFLCETFYRTFLQNPTKVPQNSGTGFFFPFLKHSLQTLMSLSSMPRPKGLSFSDIHCRNHN